MKLFIKGMRGLGDAIYMRPFVRNTVPDYEQVWLETPWPELFADIPGLLFHRPRTKLRAQRKHVDRQPDWRWTPYTRKPRGHPQHVPALTIDYYLHGRDKFKGGNIPAGIERCLPASKGRPIAFDLPDFRPHAPRLPAGKPLAVVRPVTLRSEWYSPARNPRPEYIADIAGLLARTHTVVSVADLERAKEWPVDPLPPAAVQFHSGELQMPALLGLIQSADVVLGGVGWIVPAGIAASVKTFIVFGGMLATNGPDVITDPRFDLSNFGFAMPVNPCLCARSLHKCAKTIPNLREQWDSFAFPRSLPTFSNPA